jgi:hypothetical protein
MEKQKMPRVGKYIDIHEMKAGRAGGVAQEVERLPSKY